MVFSPNEHARKVPGKRNINANEVLQVIFPLYLKLSFFTMLSAESILLQIVPKAKAGGAVRGPLGYTWYPSPPAECQSHLPCKADRLQVAMAAAWHRMLQPPLQLGGRL